MIFEMKEKELPVEFATQLGTIGPLVKKGVAKKCGLFRLDDGCSSLFFGVGSAHN